MLANPAASCGGCACNRFQKAGLLKMPGYFDGKGRLPFGNRLQNQGV
jgi:hypothetical protein